MTIHTFGQLNLRLAGLLCAALFLTLAATGHASAATCRVTTAGTNAGTGSWASPMNLQTALATGSCTEVWVAAGVYKPGLARTDTFNIKPGVAIYGGFAGTETSRGARNPSANLTILSGDIDNNDINTDGNNIAETSVDIQGNNSYHVVFMDGTTGTKITASTVLDGFTITGGLANGASSPQYYGGGFFCDGRGSSNECSPTLGNLSFSGNSAGSGGGAMYNAGGQSGSSSPILSNVTFNSNSATNGSGGAMYNAGTQSGSSSPILSNVTFSGNSALFGGAMNNDGTAALGSSSPILSNVTFSGNSANYSGGAMYNAGYHAGISSPVLSNVTFSGNSATNGSGGAVFNLGFLTGTSSPTLSNVTFSGNSAGTNGGAMINYSESGTSIPILSNVILWGDTATTSGPEIHNKTVSGGTANSVIDHSVVQGSGGSASWDTGLGIDGGGNLDADPLLGSLGLHGGSTATLLPGAGSSAIDTGNATTCSDPNTVNGLDQRGITRPQGAACDIGAVEIEAANRIFADGFEAMP